MSRGEKQPPLTWWNGMHMYWRENQVLVAFQVPSSQTKGPFDVDILKQLQLDTLDSFLQMRGLRLSSFSSEQTARLTPTRDVDHKHEKTRKSEEDESALLAREEHEAEALAKDIEQIEQEKLHAPTHQAYSNGSASNEYGHHGEQSGGYDTHERDLSQDLIDPIGKYLFPSHAGEHVTVIGCFNVDAFDAGYPVDVGYEKGYENESNTRKAVHLINENLGKLREEGKVPVLGAGPNWFGGGSGFGCTTTGGPGDPPLPVPNGDLCAGASVNWSISVPDLGNSKIAGKTGKGVTVFVLDTMPGPQGQTAHVLSAAASRAGANNALLQRLSSDVSVSAGAPLKLTYQILPNTTPQDANHRIGTGRDINGKPYGYEMVDHGVFVTGIVRELANEATIEYVRVLDDFGVGDTSSLVATLHRIQQRITKGGDLYGQRVVINLSLLVSPSDDQMPSIWPGNTAYTNELLNAPLHAAIASLTSQSALSNGAVVVAAAGNGSFNAEFNGRMGPGYPAAYPEVIAVGAVDGQGKPAVYSNNPLSPAQTHGVATYGGALLPQDAVHTTAHVDAMRGVYTSSSYPALDSTNPSTPYIIPEPNNHWAYWSGTSFATPIISALAARVLESLPAPSPAPNPSTTSWANTVQYQLTDPGGQARLFNTALPEATFDSSVPKSVGVVRATQQCQPTSSGPVIAEPAQETSAVR